MNGKFHNPAKNYEYYINMTDDEINKELDNIVPNTMSNSFCIDDGSYVLRNREGALKFVAINNMAPNPKAVRGGTEVSYEGETYCARWYVYLSKSRKNRVMILSWN